MMSTKDQKHPQYHPLPTEPADTKANDVDAAVQDDIEADADLQCGLGGLRCRCMQVLAHPNAFVILIGLLYMGVYGSSGIYLAGVISTIEKRFQLKSSESGLLMSLNDIAALCGVLFVAHIGGKFHRPRVIGISGLVVALGSFLTAVPHFLYDNSFAGLEAEGPDSSSAVNETGIATGRYYETEFLCEASAASAGDRECTAVEVEASGSQLTKTWVLMIGQLLIGLGMSGLAPLSVTYVDNAVDKNLLPMYLSLMWLPMTFAPLIGFSLSGYCLSIFADFYKTNADALEIGPRDPQWQGAWWLGFIIYGFYMCLVSAPFFFFPRKMPKPKSYFCMRGVPDCCLVMLKRSQGEAGVPRERTDSHLPSSGKAMAMIKDFMQTLRRLLTNAIYVFSMAGFCLWTLSFGGYAVFSAKYVQFQFGASPSESGMLLGYTNVPGALIGIILGGIITSRLTGNQHGYAFLSIAMQSLSIVMWVIMMFIGCPNIDIAGLTAPYGALDPNTTNSLDLYATCNMDCRCEKGVYAPVCGADNVTYVTGCFAGCQNMSRAGDETVLQDCMCVGASEQPAAAGSFAVPGVCASTCALLIPYIILTGVKRAVAALSYNPSFMMYFRSVLEKDRELALGLVSFVTKILGFIPAPIFYGAVIESQCSYWQESCDETGECLLYDRPGLRLVFHGLTAALRVLGVMCFFGAAFVIVKKFKHQDTEETDEASEGIEESNGIEELKGMVILSKETDV